MAGPRKTQVRAFFGTVFAFLLIFGLLVVTAGVLGWDIPIVSDIADSLGIGG